MNWWPDWSGRRCFVVGGDPSVSDLDPGSLRGRTLVCVNEAGLSFAPWCDVLFWSDQRWLDWNTCRMHLHTGGLRVHRHSGVVPGAHRVYHRPNTMSFAMPRVGGHDSGSSAINLAWLFGCRDIVLIGFECRDLPEDRWQDGNFHRMHLQPPLPGQRSGKFAPAHRAMAAAMASRGGRYSVVNTTPDTALDCWERASLEEMLR